jgi:GH25 family lysozyme M1 (1,4-beta-N-acetylmuramidase)
MDNTTRWKRRHLAGLAAVLPVGLLTVSPVATAGTTRENTSVRAAAWASPARDHAMGSQIRKHEGAGPVRVRIDSRAIGAKASVRGIDVSSHQGKVNWKRWWRKGKRFVWIKATEGTGYRNPYFNQQYNGSWKRGFIRGAYHFALPNRSSGAAQARYFSRHGGGWSNDGRTLPGVLDMEYNPYGSTCYGLSRAKMAKWIRSFTKVYHAKWNRWPVIYTSTSWWNRCVKGSVSRTSPLWVARYAARPGRLPHKWRSWRVWQYSSSPIDKNVFNGGKGRLVRFAKRHD